MPQRIHAIITMSNMSQSQLANTLGISQSAISQWKSTGEISAANIKLLVDRLGVSPSFLLYGEEPIFVPNNKVSEPLPEYVVESKYSHALTCKRVRTVAQDIISRFGITQKQLSQLWEINEGTLSSVLTCQRGITIKLLQSAMEASNVNANYILEGSGPYYTQTPPDAKEMLKNKEKKRKS